MMLLRMIRIIVIVGLLSYVITGCNSGAWRASTQELAKQQCEQAPASERDRCLERLKQQTTPN